jgi:UDP-glucuronate decarboxylase
MSLNDGRVVTNFIGQALRNEPITIYGDGLQSRSFCYVDDLVLGLSALFDSPQDVLGPINLGNPVEFTMIELANLIIQLTNSNSKLNFEDLPQDDPKQRKPDITKAQETLSWSPRVALEDGLVKTIEYLTTQI